MYKEYSVAGINMENRHLIIREIIDSQTETAKVEVVPEPDNKFDPNAKAVYIDGKKIGYIPKALTADLPSPTGYYAVVHGIGFGTGGDNSSYAYCIVGIDTEDPCYDRPEKG